MQNLFATVGIVQRRSGKSDSNEINIWLLNPKPQLFGFRTQAVESNFITILPFYKKKQ